MVGGRVDPGQDHFSILIYETILPYAVQDVLRLVTPDGAIAVSSNPCTQEVYSFKLFHPWCPNREDA